MSILFTATLLGLQLLPAWAAGSPAELYFRQASSLLASTTDLKSLFSFSSTHIAIATVCPPGVTATARIEGDVLATLPEDVLNDVNVSVIAIASATLPGGITTTFSKLAKRADNLENVDLDAMARLVVGSDSCQTLYAPTSTADCSTVVTPGAMPPVTVTDCEQYITFSSETLLSCAATPTFTPLVSGFTTRTLAPATSQSFPSMTASATVSAGLARRDQISFTVAIDVPMSLPRRMIDLQQEGAEEKRQLLMYPGLKAPILTELVTVAPDPSGGLLPLSTPTFSFPSILTEIMPVADQSLKARDTVDADITADTNLSDQSDIVDEEDAIRLAQLSPPSPTVYYAAPWEEIVAGGVPTQVQAVVCVGGLAPGETEDGDCTTYSEAWSVTSLTRTQLRTSIASFDGPAVVTYAGSTRTTIIHFTQTITTSVVVTYPSVARSTLGATVTEVRTNPGHTQTYSLLSLQSTPPVVSSSSSVNDGTAETFQAEVADAATPESGAFSPSTVVSSLPSMSMSTIVMTSAASIAALSESVDADAHIPVATSIVPFQSLSSEPNLNEGLGAKVNIDGYEDVSATDLPMTVTEHLTVATQTVTVIPDGVDTGTEVSN